MGAGSANCDADPEVLSKYVLALIQNDPKKDGLPETCVSKLEEFLGDETRGFVARLFKALESGSYKSNGAEQGGGGEDDRDGGDEENSRRRGRAPSEDDDERRRSKRRRDDDRAREAPRREVGRRQPAYAGRGDMRAGGGRGGPHNGVGPGPMGGGRGDQGFNRPRNFAPEWGMPPPQHMGMWPPPHFAPPRGGYGMPDFDPNGFNPENPAMAPPPHLMIPRHMGGGGPFFPHQGGRGGRGGRFGGRGGEFPDGAGKDEHETAAAAAGAKTTLRVSNVDPKYVNMTKLSLHFSKFGNVVNVQMRPSFKCAYVQYATEEEAKKAFHSPIPVCNNRFIEVKWAKYDAKDPHGAPSVAEQTAAEGKEGDEASTGTHGAAVSSDSGGGGGGFDKQPGSAEDGGAAATELTPEELRAAALEQGRKVLEQKRELLEKQRQLMKQKEALIKRQLSQHKELLERMSQNSDKFSLGDKRDLLNKIMALSQDLKALQPRGGAALGRAAAATSGGGGGDSSGSSASTSGSSSIVGLKEELSALEAEASTSGAVPSGFGGGRGVGGRWGAGGGRGFQRGGGRGGRGSHTLDNRTTIVKVANLPEAARDSSVLEQHFGNFGAIERVVVDEASPSLGFIKFQDRYGGQAALSHGGVFGDTALQLAWAEPHEAPATLSQRQGAPADPVAVTGESPEAASS
ncbi:hypothetical protein PybrP1_005514 [[Pythium] brassicae (nom. inval.)]|nr:hypothetical protein PybrP1_005514 [[Pythium] brassicae (nom. inval.)]